MTINQPLLACVVSAFLLTACSTTSSVNPNSDSSQDYYTQLGVGYLQKGRLDLAQQNLLKALEKDPNSSDAHHYFALLQEALGDDEKANQHFRKALKLNNKNPELLNNYGSFLCRKGQVELAEKAFMTAVRDPFYKTPEFAFTNAGICVAKGGNLNAAEDYFKQSQQVNANYPETLYQLAKLNYQKGDNAKAQAYLYRYNAQVPATADSLALCYKIESALNESEKAEACAVQLRAKFPDSKAASQLN